jgi:hypothetical protein
MLYKKLAQVIHTLVARQNLSSSQSAVALQSRVSKLSNSDLRYIRKEVSATYVSKVILFQSLHNCGYRFLIIATFLGQLLRTTTSNLVVSRLPCSMFFLLTFQINRSTASSCVENAPGFNNESYFSPFEQ